MTKTFARTLGHDITVWQAVEILDGLTFTGPRPWIPRCSLLLWRWWVGLTFREISDDYGLSISAVQNEHAAILRRLRHELTQGEQ